MYLYKEQARDILLKVADDACDDLKSNIDFMTDLVNEDDWSLIIKSHALIESVVTELLIAKTEEPTLRSLVERLPLSDEQVGKLKLAKDYGILEAHERKFIKRLSQLRNDLVHKVENVNFDLSNYISSFDTGQKKAWRAAFTWYEHDKEVKKSWSDATLNNPKTAIWLSIVMFVGIISMRTNEIKGLTSIKSASIETAKKLLKQ